MGGVSISESRLDTSLQKDEPEDQSDDEDKENEPEDEEEEEDDDGGGWITPSNIKQVKMESADWTAPADVRVGCLTTDFAMQVTDAPVSDVRDLRFSPLTRDSVYDHVRQTCRKSTQAGTSLTFD